MSVRNEMRPPIDETIRSSEVMVQAVLDSPLNARITFGDETEMSWEADGTRLRVNVADVKNHALLVVE